MTRQIRCEDAPGAFHSAYYGCNIYRATSGGGVGIRWEAYAGTAGTFRFVRAQTLNGIREAIRAEVSA